MGHDDIGAVAGTEGEHRWSPERVGDQVDFRGAAMIGSRPIIRP